MKEILFLTIDQVLRLHQNTIQDHGGKAELRDKGLLISAIAQPEASYGGIYLHDTVFKMAAAYFFHISQNQPFTDGNKRVGLLSMFTFLEINGYELSAGEDEMYSMLISVAEGQNGKEQLAEFIELNTTNNSK